MWEAAPTARRRTFAFSVLVVAIFAAAAPSSGMVRESSRAGALPSELWGVEVDRASLGLLRTKTLVALRGAGINTLVAKRSALGAGGLARVRASARRWNFTLLEAGAGCRRGTAAAGAPCVVVARTLKSALALSAREGVDVVVLRSAVPKRARQLSATPTTGRILYVSPLKARPFSSAAWNESIRFAASTANVDLSVALVGKSKNKALDSYLRMLPRARRAAAKQPGGAGKAPTDPFVRLVGTTQDAISVMWDASVDDTAVEEYGLYLNGRLVSTTRLPWTTLSGLTCGTEYTLEVDAADTDGNRSNRSRATATTKACSSPSAGGQTPALPGPSSPTPSTPGLPSTPDSEAPSAPSGLSLGATTSSTITLLWGASSDNVGVTAYHLYNNGAAVGSSAILSGLFTGLACGASYTLGVEARDAAGNASSRATITASTTACPAAGTGNVFVSANGSDAGSNCVRSAVPTSPPADLSTACATFGKAYLVAQPGDTVLVTPGTYGTQVICKSGAPPCVAASQKGGPEITFKAQGGLPNVTVNSIELGANIGSENGNPPSYLVFDGFAVNGHVWAIATTVMSTNFTFRNGHVYDVTNAGDGLGRAIVHNNTYDNFVVEDSEIGPACCSADLVRIDPSAANGSVPKAQVFEDSYVHDAYDTCTVYPAAYVALYGACSGTGAADNAGAGIHVDGFHVWAADGLTIRRNRIYRVGDNGTWTAFQPIFMSADQTAAPAAFFRDVLIENNLIYGGEIGNNAVSIGCGAAGLSCTTASSGYLKILYNTVWGSVPGFGNITVGDRLWAAGTTVTIAGNIALTLSMTTTLVDKCTFLALDGSTTISPTYRNNMWGNHTCDASDLQNSPTLASVVEAAPDLHLTGAQPAVNGGEPTFCPGSDVDGNARPAGGACDIGADEAG